MPGLNVIKMGTLDDENAIKNPEWNLELFTKNRLPQCEAIKGAQQAEGNPGA